MRRAVALLFIILFSLFISGCGERAASPEGGGKGGYSPDQPGDHQAEAVKHWDTPTRSSLASTNNDFGFRLFRELVKTTPDSNVVVSPLSVALALGMTMNGADGLTLDDMRTTLGYSGYSVDAVNRCFESLMTLLTHLDPEVRFEVANAVWCQEGVPFKEPFLDACEQFYRAEAGNLDFNRPDAPQVVNAWVSDKTHGKITEIVDRFEPLTKICLVNAIYFLGAWREALDPENTYDAPWMLPDSTWRQVRMMVGPDSCNHYTSLAGPGFRALDMAYGDSLFSMTLFVPSPGNTIRSMLEDFNQDNWAVWMSGFRPWCGHLTFPRFEVEYGVRMKHVLTTLGMGIIFDPVRADFTRMCTYFDDFYIKKVMHKTYIRVDERGTEAAAVTEVEGGPTSIPPQFMIHSPFVFVIRENTLNTVIFIGQITDPGYFTD